MTLTETSLAILALLLTPGPTNTLLAVAGAERGLTRAARLIPFEAAGYALAVIPLMVIGEQLLATVPQMRLALTAGAAVWVMWLAIALWRDPGPALQHDVTPRRVFITTLTNPKALIFGLVLLPAAPSPLSGLAAFGALIVVVAICWGSLGAVLSRYSPIGQTRTRAVLRKAAAFWLAALSLGLAVNAVSA